MTPESVVQEISKWIFGEPTSLCISRIPHYALILSGHGTGPCKSLITSSALPQMADQLTLEVYALDKCKIDDASGACRGKFTISYLDRVSGTIFSADELPEGTTIGDFLVFPSR